MTTERGIAETLRVVIGSGGNPFAESRGRLLTAVMDGLGYGASRDRTSGDG